MALALSVAIVAASGGAAVAPDFSDLGEVGQIEAIDERFVPTAVAFWTGSKGVIAGSIGSRGVIARSRDGGRSWRVTHRIQRDRTISNLTVAGDRFAWAEATGCRRCRTNLLHSRDGGRTWKVVDRNRLQDVSFTNGSHGWGLRRPADDGDPKTTDSPYRRVILKKTRDGGRSWVRRAEPCRATVAASISRISRRKGWIVCASEPGVRQQLKTLKRTLDGGQTWQKRPEPPRKGYVDEIFFLPRDRGWLWGWRYKVHKTSNGGRTWRQLEYFEPDQDFVESMWFVNKHRGYAAYWYYDSGQTTRTYELVTTRDGGNSWRVRQRWH